MPWDIKRGAAGCKGYAVVKDDGKLVGCHESESKAKAHMRALYANESDSTKKIKKILGEN
jgi:hypothetical protein